MPEPRRSIQEIATRLTQPWTHLVLGQVDDYCAYLSRFLGSYVYHQHTRDELYLVLEGEIYLDYADGSSILVRAGESVVVRAYENHRSRAEKEALVLMFKAKDLFAE